MRSNVLRKYGLFDAKLFLTHIETGWCLRIANKNYKSLYVPNSIIWHKVAASFEKDEKDHEDENETSIYYYIRNWILVMKDNKSLPYFLINILLQTTAFALVRFLRYAKHGRAYLMKSYYIAVWHAIINKTPLEIYPYKK